MKTISEIARELGLSRQALYKRINSKPLKDQIAPFMDTSGSVTLIKPEGEAMIWAMYEGHVNSSVNPVNQVDNSPQTLIEHDGIVSTSIAAYEDEIERLIDENKMLRDNLGFFRRQYEAAQSDLSREREHNRDLSDCVVSLSVQLADVARKGQTMLLAEHNQKRDAQNTGRVRRDDRRKGLFFRIFGRKRK